MERIKEPNKRVEHQTQHTNKHICKEKKPCLFMVEVVSFDAIVLFLEDQKKGKKNGDELAI